jgi:hypothetical protein
MPVRGLARTSGTALEYIYRSGAVKVVPLLTNVLAPSVVASLDVSPFLSATAGLRKYGVELIEVAAGVRGGAACT